MHATDFARRISPWLVQEAPLGVHIGLAIRQAINSGQLAAGDQLPPERAMAAELHVSRPTISAVVDDLRRSGLVVSRQGSGTWVAETAGPTAPPVPFAELLHGTGLIDLAAAVAPDAGFLPQMRIETTDFLAVDPASGFAPLGIPALRHAVAERQRRWRPDTTPAEVVVTSGAHQALALLVSTLAPRGSRVLVEDLTYGGLFDIIRTNGCVAVGMAADDDGPCPDSLRRRLERDEPSLVVIVASVHSPTGAVMTDERAADLATILRESPATVIVDETYADLSFGRADRALATALAPDAIVVGSLSKSLWTGLRTGWIVAPESVCENILRRRWSMFDLGPAVPSQLLAVQAMTRLDTILAGRIDHLRASAELLGTGLARLEPTWEVTPPQGGLALWVRTTGTDGRVLADAAADRGVAVLPGSACRVGGGPDDHVRLCFDRPPEVLTEALDRLAG
ncbi:MAG: PLP-dependent aminotransferase family protein [Actinomycetota bacterium]